MTDLILIVSAREKRRRISEAFAQLLLTNLRHTFDLSDTDDARQVMRLRQEAYAEVLWLWPIETIEAAAIVCGRAAGGWFPAAGEWAGACRAHEEAIHQRAQIADGEARAAEHHEARLRIVAESDPDRVKGFLDQLRAVLKRKVMK